MVRTKQRHYGGATERSYNRDNFDWNIFVSEPDLPRLRNRTGSWWYTPDRNSVHHPHEYITVDELITHRKRQFSQAHAPEHLASSFTLYNKSEPSLPSAVEQRSEYAERFQRQITPVHERTVPLRRSTSLHIEPGTMKGLSENHAKFVCYSQDTISKSRPPAIRPEESFKLPEGRGGKGNGLADAFSEYKSAFLPYDFLPKSMEPRHRNLHRRDKDKQDDLSASDSKLHNKQQLARSNLRLTGEATFEPEYATQYLPLAADKSRSTPQLNNIAFTGNFCEAPSEYKECYKYYDHFTKSAPIRKFDNLSLHGTIEFRPEYKESYRELPTGGPSDQWRSQCIVRKDNLSLKGEFLGREPEYSHSFRNPHIKCKPEKAKPKDNFLAMQGDMDYTPMYRCSYIDYPRTRPLVKKPVCSINLEDVYEKPPQRRSNRRSPSPTKYNIHAAVLSDAKEGLDKFYSQPEYRKAQRELMIKKRSPPKERGSLLAQRILQDSQLSTDSTGHNKQPTLPIVQIDTVGTSSSDNSTQNATAAGSTTGAAPSSSSDGLKPPVGTNSPIQLPVRIAKHGRRAKSPIIAIQRENEPVVFYKDLHRKAHHVRNRTKVIEGNPAYHQAHHPPPPVRPAARKHHPAGAVDKGKASTQSFVVLNAPAKHRANRWAEPATIYDSHFY
ncbi:uncharacterized protein LOC125955517 [Anopheles darlingi]|uniref:uncharacterized protein LOC125955517 n=1 Tax=Anopheles darlingi TaxID=43151 RepID=UPI002100155F|nr:uncharacterized protein LOC125955517 [Anopheles darlingi]